MSARSEDADSLPRTASEPWSRLSVEANDSEPRANSITTDSVEMSAIKTGRTAELSRPMEDREGQYQETVWKSSNDAASMKPRPKVRPAREWVEEDLLSYKMNSDPRGYILIINNIIFHKEADLPRRKGAERDREGMVDLFRQLNFEVKYHENKTKKEMIDIFREVAEYEVLHSVDCFFCVVMSHGDMGNSREDTVVFGVDGLQLQVYGIINFFSNGNCRKLINKPKVFIIQACRGRMLDFGIQSRTQTDGIRIKPEPKYEVVRNYSDMLIVYPVAPGYSANRDIYDGTWFIEAFIEVMAENAWKYHFETILKLVDYKIKMYRSGDVTNYQAVSTKTIAWSKNLYFNPGLSKLKEAEIAERTRTSAGVAEVDSRLDRRNRTSESDKSENCLGMGCNPKNQCSLL